MWALRKLDRGVFFVLGFHPAIHGVLGDHVVAWKNDIALVWIVVRQLFFEAGDGIDHGVRMAGSTN